MVDVLLVNPPSESSRFTSTPEEHLGLAYMTSALRQDGFSVEIIDAPAARLDYADLTKELSRRHFQLLGVSNLFQSNLASLLTWLETLKAGGLKAHITLGGHPATFTYREILTEFDAVDSCVRGEGEITIVELARALLTGADWRAVDGIAWRDGDEVIVNPGRPLIEDLNALAWPARDVRAAQPQAFETLTVSYSRGCQAFCSFCSIASFYRSFKGPVWRGRDPEDLLDEIDAAQMIAPKEMVLFIDDTFIGPGKIGKTRAYELAEAFAARSGNYVWGAACRADQVDEELFRKCRAAGLRVVFLGIESGNQETLRVFNKETTIETNKKAIEILKKVDIVPEMGFIMFNPYTTFTNVRQDLDFLLETGCGPDVRQVSQLWLFPGQQLLSKLQADGLLGGSPLAYHSKYVDERVGMLYKALEQMFHDQAYPAVQATQLIRAARFGRTGPGQPSLAAVEKAVAELRRIVYEIINKAVDFFEFDNGPDRMPLLTKELSERCNRLLDDTERDVGRPLPAGNAAAK
ncbi:MAG: radical SAM protein [Actinomycetota bacterium]|nr:radical SAM protein [Actinomycetota bacterium]